MITLFGIFIILHGFVFLLYAGHSLKLFELKHGMTWPEDSWTFSRIISNSKIRIIAGVNYIISTLTFVIGGFLFLLQNGSGIHFLIFASIFSTILILLFWDGKRNKLADKGGIGLLINITVLLILYFQS